MDLVKTYQKRLQDGIAAVEHDITARTQQIEGLTKRLEERVESERVEALISTY